MKNKSLLRVLTFADIVLVKSWAINDIQKVFFHKFTNIENKKPLSKESGFTTWWCLQESNQGHKDFQSFALPTELRHQLFAGANIPRFIYLPKINCKIECIFLKSKAS